jgi:hypothetical protein
VAAVDVGLARVVRLQEAEIADALDLGMVAEELADLRAFSPARLMRSSSVSRLMSSIQAVLGSVIVPIVLRIIEWA